MSLPAKQDLLKLFSAYLNEAGLSSISIKNYLSDLRHFLTYCEHTDTEPSNISIENIFQNISKYVNLYSENQKINFTPQNSINRRLASIRRFSTFLKTSFNINETETDHNISSSLSKDISSSYGFAGKSIDDPYQKIISQFRTYLQKEKKSHSTIKNYISDVNHFITWSANQTPFSSQRLEIILSQNQLSTYTTYEKLSHTSTSVINRRLSSIKKFTHFAFDNNYLPSNPFEKQRQVVRLAPLAWLERLSSHKNDKNYINNDSRLRRIKDLYQKYNSLRFTPYLHLAILVLATSAMAIFAYNQIITAAFPSQAATPPVTPNRQLSFQGRLTDSSNNPITTAVNVTFRLYDQDTAGTQLYTSSACPITPDQNGIFSTLIGNGVCGSAIPATVFSNNRDVFIEIQVAAETLTPRQQIATVGYALNSDTLQGYPASASATINTVPVMNNDGNIVLAQLNPAIVATGSTGTFSIRGETLALQTTAGSGGNIVLQPDTAGAGNIQMLTSGATGIQTRLQNANLTTGTLISGYSGNNNDAPGLIVLSSGSTETEKFAVRADGQTRITTDNTLVNAAFMVNQVGSGDIFTASQSGGNKFVIKNDGKVGIGITNPTFGLEVNDTVRLNGATTLGDDAADTITSTAGILSFTNPTTVALNNTVNSLNFDSNTLTIDALNNRVGIGLTNPSYSLDVSGDINLTGAIRDNGNAGLSGQVLSSTGTGVEWVDASAVGGVWQRNLGALSPLYITDSVNIGATATTSATVHLAGTSGENSFINTGNFGIGTTSPGYKLDINAGGVGSASHTGVNLYGNASGSIATMGYQLQLDNTTANASGYLRMARTAATVYLGLEIGSQSRDGIRFLTHATTPVEVMRINATGNLGIGTTTPTAKLEIVGDASSSGSLVLRGTNPSTFDILNGNRLDFQTSPGGDAGLLAKMTLTNDGKLGVGITNPTYNIDAVGSINASVSLCIAGDCRTSWPTSGGDNFWQWNTGVITPSTISDTVNIGAVATNSATVHLPGVTNNNAFFNLGTGNVGIGLTNPSYDFDVTGETRLNGTVGIGTVPATGSRQLNVLSDYTTTANTVTYGITNIANASPADISFATLYASYNRADLETTSWINDTINGSYNATQISQAGTVNAAYGGVFNAYILDTVTGNASSSAGIYTTADVEDGTSSSSYAIYALSPSVDTGSITTAFGIRVDNGSIGSGTIGALYPLYIDSDTRTVTGTKAGLNMGTMSGGSTNYQLYISGTANSYFAGSIGIGVTNPTQELHIVGDIRVTGGYYDSANSIGTPGQVLTSTGTGTAWGSASANYWQRNLGALSPLNLTDDINLGNTATASATVHLAGTTGEESFINAGNFGIGTTAPATQLQIDNTTGGTLRLSRNDIAFSTDDVLGDLQFYTNDSSQNTAGVAGAIKFIGGNTWNSTAKIGRLSFQTAANIVDVNLGDPVERMSITTDGSVGIGTTTPSTLLDVAGETTTNTIFIDTAGSVGTPAIRFNTNTGLYYPTTNVIGFVNNGAESARINASGNLGINTQNPGSKLSVLGNASIGSSSYSDIAAPTNGAIIEGTVGIGLTNPNFSLYKLDVNGNANITGSLTTSGAHTTTGGGYTSFTTAPSVLVGSTTIGNGGAVGYTAGSTALWSGTGLPLVFGIDGTETFRITSTGQLGYGVTNPAAGTRIQVNLAANEIVQLNDGANNSGLTLRHGSILSQSSQFQIAAVSPNPISFYTGATINTLTPGTEKLRLSSAGGLSLGNTYVATDPGAGNMIISGILGIGTTSPFSGIELDLRGDASISGSLTMGLGSQIKSAAGPLRFAIPTSSGDSINLSQIGSGTYTNLNVNGQVLPVEDATTNMNLGSATRTWTKLYLKDGIFDDIGTATIKFASGSANYLTNGDWKIDQGDLEVYNPTDVVNYGTITVGNGSGKIDVGTVDPPYMINGEKYSTYLPGMVGIKEEVTGKLTTTDYVDGVGYRTVLDLIHQPKDSDLWVFSKTSNLEQNIDELAILLTAQSQARTWYEIDTDTKVLAVYSSAPTDISFRMTAPRFDKDRWATVTPNRKSRGFVINSPDTPVDPNGTILPNYLAEIIKVSDGVYSITTNGKQNLEQGSFLQLLAANFKAGIATVSEIIVTEKLISPVADIDTLTTKYLTSNEATVSGTLYADNIQGSTVSSINEKINVLDSQYSTASAILAQLQERYSNYNSLVTATDSADILAYNPLSTPTASIPATLALDSLYASTITTQDLQINGSLIANSLNSYDSDLYIQPDTTKAVHLLGNLMALLPNGQVIINGDLLISGTIYANAIDTNQATISGQLALGKTESATSSADKLLALYGDGGNLISSVDASGSADFQQVATNELIIAAASQSDSTTSSSSTNTNATIGTAIMPSNEVEIFIPNSKIDGNTLVYLTPVSDTQNQVLFVKSKSDHQGFTVGINSPVVNPISFNYWLVKTK